MIFIEIDITVTLAAIHAICIYQKQYSRLVYTAVY